MKWIVLIRAEINASKVYEIKGRPNTGTSGFRKALSDPRSREPCPAIKITASEIDTISDRFVVEADRFAYRDSISHIP